LTEKREAIFCGGDWMNIKNLLLFTVIGLVSTACGKLTLTLEGLNPLPAELFSVESAEFVSGAQVMTTLMPSGFRVEGSVGQPFGTMVSTTSGGYTVYSTVQGQISSEPVTP
jgi:hypothetical protein